MTQCERLQTIQQAKPHTLRYGIGQRSGVMRCGQTKPGRLRIGIVVGGSVHP